MLELNDFKTVSPDDLTAALGFQIYKDLRNEEQNGDFQVNYDQHLKVFYLTKEDKAYVPVLHTKEIDLKILQALQEKLENINIYLAIVDNTANILYYQISQGLCEKPVNKNSV
ncbi:uncharacterized protein LOC108040916 isoform X1 [Drosophila rhopaloa]|uniref:tRNA-splicing endonuclease subunit Sen15 domain-containing protein n=1 Tax=Drosophila rhopaloa TaxID=1041015 RepID=A0ABM5H3W5_DRORH|nr:uncharacterized protein LOC108040916 isoform X1 [Drosophila rhopaloa]